MKTAKLEQKNTHNCQAETDSTFLTLEPRYLSPKVDTVQAHGFSLKGGEKAYSHTKLADHLMLREPHYQTSPFKSNPRKELNHLTEKLDLRRLYKKNFLIKFHNVYQSHMLSIYKDSFNDRFTHIIKNTSKIWQKERPYSRLSRTDNR